MSSLVPEFEHKWDLVRTPRVQLCRRSMLNIILLVADNLPPITARLEGDLEEMAKILTADIQSS